MKIKHILVFTLPLLMLGCKKEGTPPTGQPTVGQPIAVAEWDKVKINDSGDIFVNKKQMSLADFSAECQRLKQAGGAALIYMGDMHHYLTPVQTEAFQKLVVAKVPMKMALKESELDFDVSIKSPGP
jgi:hypothetical protein